MWRPARDHRHLQGQIATCLGESRPLSERAWLHPKRSLLSRPQGRLPAGLRLKRGQKYNPLILCTPNLCPAAPGSLGSRRVRNRRSPRNRCVSSWVVLGARQSLGSAQYLHFTQFPGSSVRKVSKNWSHQSRTIRFHSRFDSEKEPFAFGSTNESYRLAMF